MKGKFTQSEWRQLMTVPVQAFIMVAGADQKIDPEEVEEFGKRITVGQHGYRDQLHREIAADLATDFGTAWDAADETSPETVKPFLREKLTPTEYQSFLGSVFIDSLAIANATGKKKIFRKGGKISDEEKALLAMFATVWEIDPAAVNKIFS